MTSIVEIVKSPRTSCKIAYGILASQIGVLSLEYVKKFKSYRSWCAGGTWRRLSRVLDFLQKFFRNYWLRVCVTMIDKNIVIAVSMNPKWNAYIVPETSLSIKSVLGKKIVRALWSTGKAVICCISSKYCLPRTQDVCISQFCKEFDISIDCMNFHNCVET